MKRLLLLLLFLSACAPQTDVPATFPAATITPPASSSDPEMGAAFAEARATLNEFISLLAEPNPTRTFAALKVRFTLPDGSTQDIWCDDVSYVDGQFTGNMGDDILALRLSFGERISIATADIVDWMIVQDGKLIGGFTIRLAYSRMTPEEKQFFLDDAGYSIEE